MLHIMWIRAILMHTKIILWMKCVIRRCPLAIFSQEKKKNEIRLITQMAMVLIRAMVQDFAFGERSTFYSTRLRLIKSRTSIFYLMRNLIPLHDLPFAICILFPDDTVHIKIKVIHFQRPIVLMSINLNICMWHISKKSNSSSFYWYHSCIMSVMHDRVHCHSRWQCHVPLFASFTNLIKASLPNSAMVWLQRLSHLMAGDLKILKISSTTRCLQLLLVILRIIRAYWDELTGVWAISVCHVK